MKSSPSYTFTHHHDMNEYIRERKEEAKSLRLQAQLLLARAEQITFETNELVMHVGKKIRNRPPKSKQENRQ